MQTLTRIFGIRAFLAKAAASAAPIRVACVGDSITAGVGASHGNDYPAQLGRMLGPQYTVKNFGVAGSTLLKRGDRPYQKQRAFKKAKVFNPDIVVIKLGTNDTKLHNWKFKDEFIVDYKDMVIQFCSLPSKPKIFLSYPAPVARADKSSVNEERVQEIIEMIGKIGIDLQTGVIDVHGALSGHPEWLPDGVHPNTAGATAIANAVYKTLTKTKYVESATLGSPSSDQTR
jgi:acyl-CoA thioesterase I